MSKFDVLKVKTECLEAQVKMLEAALENVVIPDCDSCPTHIPKADCEGNFYRTKIPSKVIEQEVARRTGNMERAIYLKIKEKFEDLQADEGLTDNFKKYVGCENCSARGIECPKCFPLYKFIQNQVTLFLLEG